MTSEEILTLEGLTRRLETVQDKPGSPRLSRGRKLRVYSTVLTDAMRYFPELETAVRGHVGLLQDRRIVPPLESPYATTFQTAFGAIHGLSHAYGAVYKSAVGQYKMSAGNAVAGGRHSRHSRNVGSWLQYPSDSK